VTLWITLIPFEHGIPKVSAPLDSTSRQVLMSGMASSMGVTLYKIASIKKLKKKKKVEIRG
jgi:hypothetical protein